MDEVINWLMSPKPYLCLATAAVSLAAWIALRRFIKKVLAKSDRTSGLATVLLNIARYVILILCVLVILQVNGINVSSAIAGLGIASVIVGLALQDPLRDIIMGINIINENFFRVGDVIKVGDHVGRVTNLSLRSTKLVNSDDGYEVRLCNRNIDTIYKFSDMVVLDIPLSYNESREKVKETFKIITSEISSWKEVKKVDFLGIQDYRDSAIIYRLKIYVPVQLRMDIRRRALQKVDEVLINNSIAIPFPQLDVHMDKIEKV